MLVLEPRIVQAETRLLIPADCVNEGKIYIIMMLWFPLLINKHSIVSMHRKYIVCTRVWKLYDGLKSELMLL